MTFGAAGSGSSANSANALLGASERVMTTLTFALQHHHQRAAADLPPSSSSRPAHSAPTAEMLLPHSAAIVCNPLPLTLQLFSSNNSQILLSRARQAASQGACVLPPCCHAISHLTKISTVSSALTPPSLPSDRVTQVQSANYMRQCEALVNRLLL